MISTWGVKWGVFPPFKETPKTPHRPVGIPRHLRWTSIALAPVNRLDCGPKISSKKAAWKIPKKSKQWEFPHLSKKLTPKTNMEPPQNESSDGFPFFGVIFKWNMLVFGEYTPTNLGFSINYYYVTMSDHWRVKFARVTRFCLSVFSARLFFCKLGHWITLVRGNIPIYFLPFHTS